MEFFFSQIIEKNPSGNADNTGANLSKVEVRCGPGPPSQSGANHPQLIRILESFRGSIVDDLTW